MLTFSSSFGQTFFISIFAGEIRGAFGLTHGQWGGIYTLGTLTSAVAMLWAGGLADRIPVRRLSVIVLVLLSLVCISMALAPAFWILPLVIFGLRFCGQGMLSHIAIVALGKWFARQRGRANSIISLGFLTGEALLPVTFVLLTGVVGWRWSWGIAALIPLLAVPMMLGLLAKDRVPQGSMEQAETPGMDDRHWTRRQVLAHWLFWVTALGYIAPPTFGTAFFFQQVHLVELKGWTLEQFTALMPIYTLCSLGTMLITGGIVDKFGPARLMPVFMLPFAFGMLLLAQGQSIWFAAVTLALFGMMQGIMVSISAAFWPEYYGTRYLGSVRAVAMATMVFGSAIGPGITGVLIDLGVDFRTQMVGMAMYMLAISVLFAFVFLRLGRPSAATA